MARDLFEEAGIKPVDQGRDLFAEAGIKIDSPESEQPLWARNIQSIEDVAKDVGSSAAQAVTGFPNFLKGLYEEVQGFGEQARKEPLRPLKNLLYGTEEAVRGTLNLPSKILKYAGQKNLLDSPVFGQALSNLAAKAPEIPEPGLKNALGLGAQKSGDVLAQMLPSGYNPLLRYGAGEAGLAGMAKRRAGEALTATTMGANPVEGAIYGPLLGKAARTIGEETGVYRQSFRDSLRKKFEQAKQDAQAAEDLEASVKSAGKRQGFGDLDPDALYNKQRVAENKIKTARQSTQSKIDQAAEKANQAIYEANQKWQQAEDLQSGMPDDLTVEIPDLRKQFQQADAQKSLEGNINQLGKWVDPSQPHDVNIKNALKEGYLKHKEPYSQKFTKFYKGLNDKYLPIEQPKPLDFEFQKQLKALEKSDPAMFNLAKKEIQNLSKLTETTYVPAGDYTQAYQDASSIAKRLFKESNEYGLDANKRNQLKKTASDLEQQANEMRSIIKSKLGEDVVKELDSIRSDWGKNVVPAYSHKLYKEAFNPDKQFDISDVLKELRGAARGDDIWGKIIKKDPNLLKSTLNHKYSKLFDNEGKLKGEGDKKINPFLFPSQHEQSFIDASPNHKGIQERLKGALQTIQNLEPELEGPQGQKAALSERYNQFAQNKKVREQEIAGMQSNIDRLNKEAIKQINDATSAYDKIKKDALDNFQAEMIKLKKQMVETNQFLAQMEQAMINKEISKEKLARIQEKYDKEMKKQRQLEKAVKFLANKAAQALALKGLFTGGL